VAEISSDRRRFFLTRETRNIVLLFLTAVTFIGGYAFLRYAYKVTDTTPFTQEIVLIFLGTIATVLITALLLNKQTAVEVQKEQNIRFLELKKKTYEELINQIEEIVLSENITDEDIVRFQFITHRLAITSSPPVLEEYHHFLEALNRAAKDGSITGEDPRRLAESLANLTVKIRADLIGDADKTGTYSREQIKRLILRNSDESMELSDG